MVKSKSFQVDNSSPKGSMSTVLGPRNDRVTVQLHVRIDTVSHAKLSDDAEAAGLTKAIWLEQAIIQNQTTIVSKERSGLKTLVYQVCRAGNNINQLARSFNVLLLMKQITHEEFTDAMRKLDAIDEELGEAIRYAR